jgi:hypothetical protein
MNDVVAALVAILGGLALLFFVSFLLAWPMMMLWNGCLVDAVTGVKEIGWLQAWGLQFLFAMLLNRTSKSAK